MATYKSGIYNKYQWYIDVSESSVDTVNNTSKVTVKYYMKKEGNNTLSYNNYGTTATLSINGTEYKTTGFKFDLRKSAAGTTKTIMNKTVTIPHNADGSKSIRIIGKHWTNIVSGSNGHSTVDVNVGLTKINRVSNLSVPSGTHNIGSNVTISAQPYSTSYTHTLNISLDNSTWTELKKGWKFPSTGKNSFTFTIPDKYKSQV